MVSSASARSAVSAVRGWLVQPRRGWKNLLRLARCKQYRMSSCSRMFGLLMFACPVCQDSARLTSRMRQRWAQLGSRQPVTLQPLPVSLTVLWTLHPQTRVEVAQVMLQLQPVLSGLLLPPSLPPSCLPGLPHVLGVSVCPFLGLRLSFRLPLRPLRHAAGKMGPMLPPTGQPRYCSAALIRPSRVHLGTLTSLRPLLTIPWRLPW